MGSAMVTQYSMQLQKLQNKKEAAQLSMPTGLKLKNTKKDPLTKDIIRIRLITLQFQPEL